MGFTREELNDLLGYDFYQFPGVNMQDGFDMTVPTNQQMATPRSNLPDDQYVELGQSYGSNPMTPNNQTTNITQNLATGSTYAGRETSNSPVPKNSLGNLPQHDHTSSNPFVAMLQPAHHPIREQLDTGSPSGGIYRPQFNQASNSNISQTPYINESSESPAVHYKSTKQGLSSFDHLLQGGPEPYFPIMDSFGSLDESNQQPGLDDQNSGQDLMVSDYFTSEQSDSPLVDSQNMWQPGSSSFNSPTLTITPQSTSTFEHNQVDLNPQHGVAQSFYPEQEINLIQPNQPSTFPKNPPPTNNMHLSTQRMGSLNQNTSSFPDQPVDQNMSNNNFSINKHQIPNQYQSFFPQNSAELQLGNVNERQSPIPYQQQTVRPSNAHNIAYRPSSQVGPQKLSDAQSGEGRIPTNIFNSQNSAEQQVGNIDERRSPIPYQQQTVRPSNAHNIPYRPSSQLGPQKLSNAQFGEGRIPTNVFNSQNSAEQQVGNIDERRSPIPYQQQTVRPSSAHNIPYRPSSQLGPQKLSDAQSGEDRIPTNMLKSQNSAEQQVGNGDERRSSIPYQQQAVRPSTAHHIPYRPSNQLRPQNLFDAQFGGEDRITNNIFESRNLESMLPEKSVPSRPEESAVQRQPLRPQLEMPPNIPNPQLYSHPFQSSVPSRSSLPLPDSHNKQGNEVQAAAAALAAPSNAISSQRNKSKLPEPSILSRPKRSSVYPETLPDSLKAPNWTDYLDSVTLAPPGYLLAGLPPSSGPSLLRNRSSLFKANSSAPHHQELNQQGPSEIDRLQKELDDHSRQNEALLRPAAPGTPPRANALLQIPLLSRAQQITNDLQQCKSSFAPDASDFRRGMSVLLEPSRSSRQQDIGQFQGSPDPNSRSSVSITESPSPLSPQLNPQSDQQKGKEKVHADSSNPFAFGESLFSSTGDKKGKEKVHADSSNPFAFGESLFSSRSDKGKYPMFPPVSISDHLMKGITLSQIKDLNDSTFNKTPVRVYKNMAYDPAFEALGIPIDPHLRLFAQNDTPPDYSNKRPRLDKP